MALRLSPRETQICDLFLDGYEHAEIAEKLGITLATVKQNFNRIYIRAGINSEVKRVKLAVLLYRERNPKCS